MRWHWTLAMAVGLGVGFGAGRGLWPEADSAAAHVVPVAEAETASPPPVQPPAPSPPAAAATGCEPGLELAAPSCAPEPPIAAPGESAAESPAESPADGAPKVAPYCALIADFDVRYVLDEKGKPVELVDPGPTDFARYRGHTPEAMGDGSVINGALTHVGHLRVSDPPEVVLDYYRRQFALNDMVPMEGAPMGRSGPHYLSYRPHGGKLMAVITVVPDGDGSEILASEANPKDMADGSRAVMPPDLPSPPGAESFMVNEVDQGSGRQQNISFEVAASTVDKVSQFYDTALAKGGYYRDTTGGGPNAHGGWQATFSTQTRSLVLTVREVPPGSGRVMVDMISIEH